MSTNNPTSGQVQEDVKKVPSVPHDKQKIQGAEKNAMDHAHDNFYKNFKPDPEVVMQMKNKQDVTHKLPSEVEQRLEKYKGSLAESGYYGKNDKNNFKKHSVDASFETIKTYLVTEQVALLTRVLGLIKNKSFSGISAKGTTEHLYDVEVNKELEKLREQVQAIIKEYEV